MTNEVGILAYRAFTDNEEDAAGGLNDFGRWFLLDELAPGWRDAPNGYLLWTAAEDPALVAASAAKFLRLNKDVRVIVALGRRTARALGVPNDMDWFTGYGMWVGKRRIVVIPIPSPSPVNRTVNDKNVRKKIKKLFNKLLNDPTYVRTLTGDAA
jgi:hypothetical protein